MTEITHHSDCRQAQAVIKRRMQTSQTRAVLAVNAEVLGHWPPVGLQTTGQLKRGLVRTLLAKVKSVELGAQIRDDEYMPND